MVELLSICHSDCIILDMSLGHIIKYFCCNLITAVCFLGAIWQYKPMLENRFWMKVTFKLVKKLLHYTKEKSENTKENSENHIFQVFSD